MMETFSGTWRLVRLAIRLDRIKLSIWIAGIIGMMGSSALALGDLYDTYEKQVQYAATTAPSTVGRAFGGLVNGPSLGSIAMVELFYFTAILMAFMSTLLVIRHTRKAEETGAAELIGSGLVGRYASLSAAMILAVGANLVVGILMWLVLSSVDGLGGVGAAGFSLALALTGITFAGVAGIAAQLSETARGANSIAGAVIGAAFVLRAIGDGFGKVAADGLSASPIWVSWLSPLGWAYQIHPYTSQRWWLFSLLFGLMLLTMFASFAILRRRDVGLGIIPSRAGRAKAKPSLLSTWGLSWRLQRGTLIGWSIGFLVFGLIAGGMASDFSSLIASNDQAAEIFAELGGDSASMIDIFFGAMFSFATVTAAGYAAQSLTKARSEEASGHLEALLSTRLSRTKWLLSHVLITIMGSVVVLGSMGIMSGVVFALSGGTWAELPKLILAMFSQLPAIVAFIGGVTLAIGLLPTLATGIAWGAFIGSYLILQLAVVLNLPDWVTNISPFGHLPNVPAESFELAPVIWLLTAGLGLALIGFAGFRRRDLTTS